MDISNLVNFQDDVVKVLPIHGELYKLKIQWPSIAGAQGYNIYGSAHILNANKLNDLPVTNTEYIVDLPIVPLDTQWFFWVKWIDNQGNEHLIQGDAATLESQRNPFASQYNPLTDTSDIYLPNEMMGYYASEIRTRHKAMLENDGEDFHLYIRRWTGLPCSCVPGNQTVFGSDPDLNMDSDYDGKGRCELCFGTGILSGYFPHLTIKIRYGDMPSRVLKYTSAGIDLMHEFNSWTLWAPRLKHHDLLVRLKTNERFLVSDPKTSEWRGIPLHQKFNAVPLPAHDIRNKVTNDKILAALELSNTFDIARFNSALWQ